MSDLKCCDTKYKIFLIAGTSNEPLANAISKNLTSRNIDHIYESAIVKRFADGETFVQLPSAVRGHDIFICQPTSPPDVNSALVELLLLLDAAKRASAARITAVLPYYGYARQERKAHPRTPITAKLVADIIEKAGADRVLTVDLHAAAIQGFFDVAVDHVHAIHIFVPYLKERFAGISMEDICIVSPDVGGAARARKLAARLHTSLAIVDKRRPRDNECEIMNVVGDVKGKHCIIVDDMVDTAGTLCKGAQVLKAFGAVSVVACISHGLLSGPAHDRISTCDDLNELIITDSIKQTRENKKVTVVSCSELLSEAIMCVHYESSLGNLMVKLDRTYGAASADEDE